MDSREILVAVFMIHLQINLLFLQGIQSFVLTSILLERMNSAASQQGSASNISRVFVLSNISRVFALSKFLVIVVLYCRHTARRAFNLRSFLTAMEGGRIRVKSSTRYPLTDSVRLIIVNP
mmetsp:Transcript_20540/g.45728  ORF Transcript_20540/g.45728 Transcript_20540/m.45728 type:complete len:121 (-) Transcript_20540:2282-2644(-)